MASDFNTSNEVDYENKKTLLLRLLLVLSPLAANIAYAENLPPDPGEAGKATLAGVDSDNDGVRDDIQRWIVLSTPDSQKMREALIQGSKARQKFCWKEMIRLKHLNMRYKSTRQSFVRFIFLQYPIR